MTSNKQLLFTAVASMSIVMLNGCERPAPAMNKFIVGTDGENRCPHGSEKITTALECEAAAVQYGMRKNDPFVVENEKDPAGCFEYKNRQVYFNTVSDGNGRRDRIPYCKCHSCPTPTPAPALTPTPAQSPTPKPRPAPAMNKFIVG